MRAFLLFALVAALCLYVVSSAQPTYKSCATSDSDLNILNITANEWPPEKDTDLLLNVTGNNSKLVKSGTYSIAIKVDGLPLPDIDGNIDVFHPLPWPVGDLAFTYSQNIPASAPSGSYALKMSAEDQDKHEVFCITLTFHVGKQDEPLHSIRSGASLQPMLHHTHSSSLKQALRDGVAQVTSKLQRLPGVKQMKKMARR